MTLVASVLDRAAASRGISSDILYERTREILIGRDARGYVADIGCGRGGLLPSLARIATRYVGIDAMRFDGFPEGAELLQANLDTDSLPVADRAVDIAIALETIEHLENPRRFVRELARVTRVGGTILISTPNQLSALSLATLVTRGQFSAFQRGEYPAHLTALLPVDLRRIAAECGLDAVDITWSRRGRIPLSGAHYPRVLSRLFPRALSDNLLMVARVAA